MRVWYHFSQRDGAEKCPCSYGGTKFAGVAIAGELGPEGAPPWQAEAYPTWRQLREVYDGGLPMCGIAGFTRLSGQKAEDLAQRIVRCLHHRGPDQQGVYEGSQATLCAVRLKIIDLSGGDQPIVSDDGDTAIAFNGEIYNHLELRRELEAKGHRFHSHCDTETVLHAFLEWDTECFRRMRGMFAVALWSESRKRLVLARDRMGIKPLYYYRARRGCVFRVGAEGDSGAPGCAAAAGPEGAGPVSFGQLCAGAGDADRGNPKSGPGAFSGMARGAGAGGGLGGGSAGRNRGRFRWTPLRKNWTGCCANRCASTWFRTCRWECGRRADWIRRPFCIMRRSGERAAEDLFGFVCGAEFRREPVFPRSGAGVWDGPPRVRPEPGGGAAGRD